MQLESLMHKSFNLKSNQIPKQTIAVKMDKKRNMYKKRKDFSKSTNVKTSLISKPK